MITRPRIVAVTSMLALAFSTLLGPSQATAAPKQAPRNVVAAVNAPPGEVVINGRPARFGARAALRDNGNARGGARIAIDGRRYAFSFNRGEVEQTSSGDYSLVLQYKCDVCGEDHPIRPLTATVVLISSNPAGLDRLQWTIERENRNGELQTVQFESDGELWFREER